MAKLTISEWIRLIFTGRRPNKEEKEKKLGSLKKSLKLANTKKKNYQPKKTGKVKTQPRMKIKKAKVEKIARKIDGGRIELKKVLPQTPIPEQKIPIARSGIFSGLFKKQAPVKTEVIRPLPRKLPKEIVKEFVASDIMTSKVISVRNNDTLSYTVRLFSDKHISGAPVMNRNGNLVGMLGQTDIVVFIGSRDLLDAQTNRLDKLKETKVEEVMRKDHVTVFEHTPIHEVNDIMNRRGIARVIVLNDKRQVVGIITRGDMVRGISKEMLLKMVHKPREFEKTQVDTDVDDVLEMVEKRGVVSVDEIKNKLNLTQDKIEEWGRILEKHNLIEIYYPPVGRPSFRKRVS